MARKGFAELVVETGTKLVAKAADTVLNDPRGKEAVATAVGIAQRGKKRIEEAQERLLRAAGIPGKEEVQELARQLARIKRKARDLAAQLEKEEGRAGDEGADGPENPR
jgi:hypothetical protein